MSVAGLLVTGGADFGRNSILPNTASSASLRGSVKDTTLLLHSCAQFVCFFYSCEVVTDVLHLSVVTDILNLSVITHVLNLTVFTHVTNLSVVTDILNLSVITHVLNLTVFTHVINLYVVTDVLKIYNITYHHYLSFTLKLHETYICILGQLYTSRKTSHFLNGTIDFYQESSPGQVAGK